MQCVILHYAVTLDKKIMIVALQETKRTNVCGRTANRPDGCSERSWRHLQLRISACLSLAVVSLSACLCLPVSVYISVSASVLPPVRILIHLQSACHHPLSSNSSILMHARVSHVMSSNLGLDSSFSSSSFSVITLILILINLNTRLSNDVVVLSVLSLRIGDCLTNSMQWDFNETSPRLHRYFIETSYRINRNHLRPKIELTGLQNWLLQEPLCRRSWLDNAPYLHHPLVRFILSLRLR